MTKSQLRDDLCKRIHERHELWYRDAMELYQMGGLRSHQFAQDAFVVLMAELVGYCIRFNLDPDEIADNLKTALTMYERRDAKQ